MPYRLLGSRARRRQARAVLERVGLGHRAQTLAANLSGGERQLAAVARALVRRPSLVLADEPTGSVDSRTGQSILDLLFGHARDSGATLVVVTHDQAVAGHADRIVSMRDGRATESATP